MDSPFTSNLAVDLGRIGYGEAYRLQKHLLDLVKGNSASGFLLFLEHTPVFTVGRKPVPENFAGVQVVQTERGGDVTYHGPGQIVIYPIVRIENGGNLDVRGFVHFVENTVIEMLGTAGYSATVGEEPGIWISGDGTPRKIASIGMAIDHGISYHGISVNISGEVLEGFSRIRPCGLDPSVMGYVAMSAEAVRKAFISAFSGRFGPFREIGRVPFMKALSSLPGP